MNENTGSSKKRKALSATLAVAMVATMLLSGTLAYYYQSRVKNTIVGAEKQVIGHDDFVEVGKEDDGSTKYNKDIYVENLGTTPVLVRVKLSEAFTLDGKIIVEGASALTHIPEDKDTLSVGTAVKDGNAADSDDIHRYFTWKMGGRKSFVSAASTIYQSDEKKEFFFNYEAGKVAQDTTVTAYTAATIDADTGLSAEMKVNMKQNLKDMTDGSVITMKEYRNKSAEGRKAFYGWVIDNTKAGETIVNDTGTRETEASAGDGWAYWSQMLKPGEATCKLLDDVTVAPELADKDYTYDIYADFEAVDLTDERVWTDNKTPNSSNMPFISAEQVKTAGAKALLAAAKANYATAAGNITDQILTAKAGTQSEAAIKVYDAAIKALNGNMKLTPTYAVELATIYKGLADDIVTKVNSTDPQVQNDLKRTVLSLNSDGTIASDSEIRAMDLHLAKTIMDKYDDGDGKLTGEEALSVTAVATPTQTSEKVTSLVGLNETNFPNLRELYVENAALPSFDLADYPHLKDLEIADVSIASGSLDFSKLESLRVFRLLRTTGGFTYKDIDSLTSLSRLHIAVPRSLQVTPEMLNAFLSSSKMEYLCLYYMDFYKQNADGTTSTTKLTTVDQLAVSGNFTLPSTLKFFQYYPLSVASGTFDLRGCTELRQAYFAGTNSLTYDVTGCKALSELEVVGTPTVNGASSDVAIKRS